MNFLENKINCYLNKLIELAWFVLGIFIFTLKKIPQNHLIVDDIYYLLIAIPLYYCFYCYYVSMRFLLLIKNLVK
ncbi:hypothetical protein H1P_6630004 [Hyella patelloides LEGE 07179]|uniref:Uncharacterized protein n=1 Tax=Hyella patelloides LEGE 07179 TaxID=945734 RepID=A0A563W343_9CYAN|nr:hypothetical protein H1P_6630004 [Hyella patelloides LEGE 07179]